jgi:hypothetical protein
VAVAAIAGFPLGALWYGPLFGKAWMAATGITKERAKQANMAMIYGTTLLLNLIIAVSLAMFIGPAANLQDGLFAGFMAGFTFVAAAFGTDPQERRCVSSRSLTMAGASMFAIWPAPAMLRSAARGIPAARTRAMV